MVKSEEDILREKVFTGVAKGTCPFCGTKMEDRSNDYLPSPEEQFHFAYSCKRCKLWINIDGGDYDEERG